MAEMLDAWFLAAFRLTCGVAGLALIVIGAASLVHWALERVLCVAAIFEAAREAQQQGRAPLLKAWLRVKPWWRA